MTKKQGIEKNRTVIHGVFLDIFDIGVLIIGSSGVGKSDCALELISRGHKLIADDVVLVAKTGVSLTGTAPPENKGLMFVRGIGFVNAERVFGPSSVTERHSLDLCVELISGASVLDADKGDNERFECLGQTAPKYVLESPSRFRPIPLLIETIVKVFVQKHNGTDDEHIFLTAYDRRVSSEKMKAASFGIKD